MTFEPFVGDLVTLFVVIDPIGTVPVFLAATIGLDAAARRRIALKAIAVSAGVLAGFLVAGQFVLEAMGIELAAFQVAGGLVLFLFALTMIFNDPKPDRERADALTAQGDRAVFPVAMPSIASPGAMLAVVVLTDNHRNSVPEQVVTALALAIVLSLTLVMLLLASWIHRLIGRTGESVISRVMGMILAAVAASNTLAAIGTYYGIR